MNYEIHPLCKILPPMNDDEYRRLVDGIKAKGLMRPITLFENQILDGRHRYQACADAGVQPRFDTYDGDDAAGFVAESCNHRSLNATQRSLIAAGFLDYEKDQAKRRQVELGKTHGTLPENFPEGVKGEARDRAGERMGVSGKTVSDAAKVLKTAAPEVVDEMRKGKMALHEAKQIAHLPAAAQKKIVALPKPQRREEINKSEARSEAASRRHSQVSKSEPSTEFVRVYLSGIERLAIYCAEQGAKTAADIAEKFESEMDWNASGLLAQFDRCFPVTESFRIVSEKKKAA